MKKRDYVWNTAAGLINAAEAVVMSMIVTRVTGLGDAGILTIAFAVGNLMMSVGKFGVRNYQATDVEKRFSFAIYLKGRIISVLFMITVTLVYLLYAYINLGYSTEKICVIFTVCLIYAVECIEDVIWGYYQNRDKLYIGAKMFCFRWLGILFVFSIALCVSSDLCLTLILCFCISVLIFLCLLLLYYPQNCDKEDRFIKPVISKKELHNIIVIFKTVFPLFAISFLSFYEHNAPKYAIDAYMTDEVQACYGFVAMPVFVIELLNNFVYQPTLVPMAIEWKLKQIKKFRIRIVRQMFVIAGISVVCIIGAYFIGIPVLSLLFHTNLSSYKSELIVLLFASSFLAVSGYLSVILTIMRCQKTLWPPHCVVSLIAAVSLNNIVAEYGTMGAAFSYLLLMVILCVIYEVILFFELRKFQKVKSEKI